jgi:hypothetical protein
MDQATEAEGGRHCTATESDWRRLIHLMQYAVFYWQPAIFDSVAFVGIETVSSAKAAHLAALQAMRGPAV